MAYSKEELSVISRQKLAEDGVRYYTTDGIAYVGTSEKRLVKVPQSIIDLENSTEQIINTVKTVTNTLKETSTVTDTPAKIYKGVSGMAISAHRAIVVIGNKVYHFDKDNVTHYNKCIGFSIQSVNINTLVEVAIDGVIDTGISLLDGALYYAGVDGFLTITAPTTGIVQGVAIAVSTSKLLVKISHPIKKI